MLFVIIKSTNIITYQDTHSENRLLGFFFISLLLFRFLFIRSSDAIGKIKSSFVTILFYVPLNIDRVYILFGIRCVRVEERNIVLSAYVQIYLHYIHIYRPLENKQFVRQDF